MSGFWPFPFVVTGGKVQIPGAGGRQRHRLPARNQARRKSTVIAGVVRAEDARRPEALRDGDRERPCIDLRRRRIEERVGGAGDRRGQRDCRRYLERLAGRTVGRDRWRQDDIRVVLQRHADVAVAVQEEPRRHRHVADEGARRGAQRITRKRERLGDRVVDVAAGEAGVGAFQAGVVRGVRLRRGSVVRRVLAVRTSPRSSDRSGRPRLESGSCRRGP